MKKIIATTILLVFATSFACTYVSSRYQGLDEELVRPQGVKITDDSLFYHKVRVDVEGNILPWYSENLGESYDHVIGLVWNFWNNMEEDVNGLKYYMNHQVWAKAPYYSADATTIKLFPEAEHDMRGLGGDQLNMALSSWNMLYDYTGDQAVLDNMKYMTDYYLAHSITDADSEWPHMPYPYNLEIHSGEYTGDMILGKGYLQPDKGGSFGIELVHLYKKTGNEKYLDAAVNIANTMATKVQPGDEDHSPWPFKVNAETGEAGVLVEGTFWHEDISEDVEAEDRRHRRSLYTTNWTPTLNLFSELMTLEEGQVEAYGKAYDLTLDWLQKYPVQTNKWGPFFEDVPGWSDTNINAITYAMFLMNNRELDPNWEETVAGIFQWVYDELGNGKFISYGVVPINEQTHYRVPGNSHSSRLASMELRYWELTGETNFYIRNAIRKLNWATYTVDTDGKNRYPFDQIWMTDGYGDYVRHYLRAMAAAPELAPAKEDHMLRTSSIVTEINYQPDAITYTTYDSVSIELFRVTSQPQSVQVDENKLEETTDADASDGWMWQPLDQGGIVNINHSNGRNVRIVK